MVSGLDSMPTLAPAASGGGAAASPRSIGPFRPWAAAFLLWIAAGEGVAHAQTASATWGTPTIASPSGEPTPFSQSVTDPGVSPEQASMMLPFGLWMFYPSILADAAYDDNVFRTPGSRVAALGFHVSPTLIADLNLGIHRFNFFGNFDGIFYPAVSSANQISMLTRGSYNWEIRRDLNFQLRGGFERSLGATTNINALANSVTFAPTPATVNSSSQFINLYRASATLEKTFNHLTTAVGVSFLRMDMGGGNQGGQQQQTNNLTINNGLATNNGTLIFNNNGQVVSLDDSTTFSASGRIGYEFTTDNYCYVEGTGNRIRYDSSFRNSKGYSAIFGVGSKQIGFFRGEFFGGYQQQFYDNPALGASSGPTFGGKLVYLPSPLLTISVGFAESVADYSAVPFGAVRSNASSTVINTSIATISYSFSPRLAAAGRFGYEWDNLGLDRRMVAGGRLSYNLDRNLDMNLDYQYTRAGLLLSGAFLASQAASVAQSLSFYNENRVSLGVAYKY